LKLREMSPPLLKPANPTHLRTLGRCATTVPCLCRSA